MGAASVGRERGAADRGNGRLRVTCCIDGLGQGGAQRQMSMLAVLLARRGYDVDVMTYRPAHFFGPVVQAAGVPIRRLPPSGRLQRAIAARRVLGERRPDVVVAYLSGPGVYAELANLPRRRFGLIVSEFSVPGGIVPPAHWLRLAVHRLADAVVTETEHNRRLLVRAAPWLADRAVVIRNGVDLREFRSANRDDASSDRAAAGPTRVLVMAGYRLEKNPFGMLGAMEHLRRVAPGERVELDWYGSTSSSDARAGVHEALKSAVRTRGMEDVFRLHDAVRDCAGLYRRASLVCLPSFFEGCSNVICEAGASGVPMVVSDIGDNRAFVIDGVTGFLADAHAPETIADAILRFHRLPSAAKREMGRRARTHAEALFDSTRFVDDYTSLIERVAVGRRQPRAG
ncbi:MAG: glycosyltransferase family 4 protein [Acidobacteria bacterium]|nr:glycosyltransferase family 4 protein [Acidobacteriota bacterium]